VRPGRSGGTVAAALGDDAGRSAVT
jgi:hypothetical protein